MGEEQLQSPRNDFDRLLMKALERRKSLPPTRESTIAEKQPDGLWNFEHLSPDSEQLDELLERYQLEVKHGSSQVWIATLLPYKEDSQPVVSQTKKPGFLQSLLSMLAPAKTSSSERILNCLRAPIRAQIEEESLQRGILHGEIDGYYCARTGSYFQDCLDELLKNVKKGVLYSYRDSFYSWNGCRVAGLAFAEGNDTLGQYLMKGRLIGSKSKDSGEVSLVLEHPTLSGLSARAKGFTEAYHILVQRTKLDLTSEKLLKAADFLD